jgi:hypothetical protein
MAPRSGNLRNRLSNRQPLYTRPRFRCQPTLVSRRCTVRFTRTTANYCAEQHRSRLCAARGATRSVDRAKSLPLQRSSCTHLRGIFSTTQDVIASAKLAQYFIHRFFEVKCNACINSVAESVSSELSKKCNTCTSRFSIDLATLFINKVKPFRGHFFGDSVASLAVCPELASW